MKFLLSYSILRPHKTKQPCFDTKKRILIWVTLFGLQKKLQQSDWLAHVMHNHACIASLAPFSL
jgi:hypothetical protein